MGAQLAPCLLGAMVAMYLTWDRLVIEVRKALSSVGIKAEDYAGHSSRIGTVTMAIEMCVQNLLIKLRAGGRALPIPCVKDPSAGTMQLKDINPKLDAVMSQTSVNV